jgi:hypothetical protein
MSKLFFTLAFAIGLAVVAWIGAGFVGSDLLALAFTGLIGAVYCLLKARSRLTTGLAHCPPRCSSRCNGESRAMPPHYPARN